MVTIYSRPLFGRMDGQALPLGLAFIMFISLATILLYNSGQLVSKKSHIANTADAAVYSGLVWQARALNFQAYTNRAMVANQVSIAQFVSLKSWTNYAEISSRNVDIAIGWIPPVKPFTAGAYQAATQVNNIVGQVANVATNVISTVTQVLTVVQQATYYSTFVVTPSIVKEVAKATNAQYQVDSAYSIASMGVNALDWQRFTKQYDDDDLNRKVDVINRSRDRFTSDRGWDVGRFTLFPLKLQIIKEGSTHLVKDGDNWVWKGKDTFSLHQWKWGCRWSGCKWRHSELPIGWGGAYASDDPNCGKKCPSWEKYNKRAGSLARESTDEVSGYGGVKAFYDLSDLSAKNKDPRLILRSEVYAPRSAMDTSSNKGFGSSKNVASDTQKDGFGNGMFRLDDNFADKSMASMSSGEVYFERPIFDANNKLKVNGREKVEYGSLWNPYWQVRLISTPKEHRLTAWGLRNPDLIKGTGGAVQGAQAYLGTQQEELAELAELGNYVKDEVAALPARLAQQAQAAMDLKDVKAQLTNSEQALSSLQQQRQTGQNALDNGKAALVTLNNDINTLTQSLNNTVNPSERSVIEAQLSALNNSQANLMADISSKQEALSSLGDSIVAQSQVIASLQNRGGQLASQMQGLEQSIENATDLEPYIKQAEDLIAQTEQSIAQADMQGAKNYVSGAKSLTQLVGSTPNVDKLLDEGKKQLQSLAEDAIEDVIKDAVSNIASGFMDKYSGNINELQQFGAEKKEELKEVANAASEDYLKPLEENLQELKNSAAQLEADMKADFDSALVEMDADIQYYKDLLAEQIQNTTDTFQAQINQLAADKAEAVAQADIDAIDNQINQLETKMQQQIDAAKQNTGSLLSSLEQNKQNVVNEFNASVVEAKQGLQDEINSLEAKIASLKAGLNAG